MLYRFSYLAFSGLLFLSACADKSPSKHEGEDPTVILMEFNQDTSDNRALGPLADPSDFTSMSKVDVDSGVGGTVVDSYGGAILATSILPPIPTGPVPYASSDSYGIYYMPNSRPVGT